MYERSNMPAAVRTVRCSASSLPKRRGISQPANLVMVAPAARCTASRGERGGSGMPGKPVAVGFTKLRNGHEDAGTLPPGVRRSREAYAARPSRAHDGGRPASSSWETS